MEKTRMIVFGLLTLVTLVLAACGGSEEPTAQSVAQAPAEPDGLALFRSLGCAGCHGQDGEGGTGPALAGHTAEQVIRQVRAPRGDVMPAFSKEQVSDDQVALIIAWVESLGPATEEHAHAHQHSAEASSETDEHSEEASDATHGHSEEASDATDEHSEEASGATHGHSEEASDATHEHSEEASDATDEHSEEAGDATHEHSEEASGATDEHSEEASDATDEHFEEASGATDDHSEEAGDATGEHSETVQPADTSTHLRLAYFAVKDGNAHDAEHHLEDLIESLADEHARAEAGDILASLRAGTDLHEIEHELEHVLEEIAPQIGEVDGPNFHLQLVLDSLVLNDLDAADHHLGHYAGLVDDAHLVEGAQALQAHLAEGDLHAIKDGVQALLTGQESDHHD